MVTTEGVIAPPGYVNDVLRPHEMTFPPPSLRENMPKFITLTSDFGLTGPYVASMKGVILGILPGAAIVDISHAIQPQNIQQAAYMLDAATPYFPAGTIHVVVVDPGVGSARRPIAVFTDSACFVGPDNGVFSRIYHTQAVREIRHLANPDYHLPAVSHTFHGRDIFAPVAAHIAAGVPPSCLGPAITDPVTIDFPAPEQCADGSILGQIIYTDAFGNLISNIPLQWLENQSNWIFEIAATTIVGLSATYSDVQTEKLIALGSSAGLVEIAKRNDSAARHLSVESGERLTVWSSL